MMNYIMRFSLGQRVLHGLLMLSFLGLVATGMPLRYNQAEWAIWLAHALGGFRVMGFFHRSFALLLTGCFMFHLGQIGRRLWSERAAGILWGPNTLVPQPRDLKDLYRHVKYFFGCGAKPVFGRFTYWEKFDYWAVFWGMLLIGGSGYVLWFNLFFSRFFPGWIFNVALLIHGEEALLAAGFIFTIHFFNSHLRPEKFPMDLVIFTGRVSEQQLKEERPAQYDELRAAGMLEGLRTDAPPAWMVKLGRTIGTLAVATGLVLFVLILIAVSKG